MKVGVLGPTCVEGDTPVDLGSRKPRAVLAALALRTGVDVSADTVVELVWGEEAPRGAHGTLHSYVSGLRRALEPGLGSRERPTLLVSTDRGYRLQLARSQVDAHCFVDEVRACHRELAPLAAQLDGSSDASWPRREAASRLADRLEQALASWRGEAYADLSDHPDVLAERAGLDQLRLTAEEDRALGLLALGDHASVVAATEQAVTRHPLRERSWALHALALARSGRQADSLAALRQIRTVLAEELGLDPGQELRDLEQLVLRQDPALRRWLRPDAAPTPPAPQASPDLPVRSGRPQDGADRAGWQTVGREAERAALRGLLDRAAAGDPAFGLV